jgi:hypothetical protein
MEKVCPSIYTVDDDFSSVTIEMTTTTYYYNCHDHDDVQYNYYDYYHYYVLLVVVNVPCGTFSKQYTFGDNYKRCEEILIALDLSKESLEWLLEN